jgi:predicted PurR-regulated permease PerM
MPCATFTRAGNSFSRPPLLHAPRDDALVSRDWRARCFATVEIYLMKRLTKTLGGWVQFVGFVLVVAVLYWAQVVLVPIALAVLLTFLLAPLALWLQRWIGRLPAVLMLVMVAFGVLGAAGWGLTRELASLADELPGYRTNIRQKIADVRSASVGGSVEKVQEALTDIKTQISDAPSQAAASPKPVVVEASPAAGIGGFALWIVPVIAPLATAGLVVVLVIFMLLERQGLRDRLITLFGHGHLALTTRALDEAATRISRYLLMQSIVNLTFGVGIAVGLYVIGVPYALLWAALAAVLRFIPYLGPWMAAGAPTLVALAALPGWLRPIEVIALFLGLELFTNLVLETVLYADAAGLSQVALLIAIAFWTWLWGPLGLLLATPLTVCLVVAGKYVPGMQFLPTLMADAPPLASDVRYYQRLLARDPSEAAELIDRYVQEEPVDTAYDALLLPALTYAERDRLAEELSTDEVRDVIDATRELLDDGAVRRHVARDEHAAEPADTGSAPALRVLGCAVNSPADELALRMLGELLRDSSIAIDVPAAPLVSSELVRTIQEKGHRVICIADLPPRASSKTRYLVKKLRASLPDLKIVVGRWAPSALADDSVQPLIDAGADRVGSTLFETREQLRQLAQFLQPTPASDATDAPPPATAASSGATDAAPTRARAAG